MPAKIVRKERKKEGKKEEKRKKRKKTKKKGGKGGTKMVGDSLEHYNDFPGFTLSLVARVPFKARFSGEKNTDWRERTDTSSQRGVVVRIELTPSNRRPTRATFSRLEVNLYTIYTSAGGTVYTSNSAPQHIAQEQERKYVHYLQEHCVIVLSFLAWLCFGISRFAFGQPLLRRLSVVPFNTGAVHVSGHITDIYMGLINKVDMICLSPVGYGV